VNQQDAETTIRVYSTQASGCCGPVVWRTLDDAVTELRELVADMSVGTSWTLTVVEMTGAEFDTLPEFEGY